MKESIYTIPISEAFEAQEGCPLCGIREDLDKHWVEYITGAAMMEPDVREQTNELGFCQRHYAHTLKANNRLSVALMLQTRLDTIIHNPPQAKITGFFGKKDSNCNCFICKNYEREFSRILDNIVLVWAREDDFKKLYIQQKYVCYKDCESLLNAAAKNLKGAKLREFSNITKDLFQKRAVSLKADIDAFCQLYDYRNAGVTKPDGSVATAVERSISFLAGE